MKATREGDSGPRIAPRTPNLHAAGVMNIFFDVDETLITWDVKLRPGVRQ